MKTKESRFQVHDELTAPERSVPVLKGALAGGGQLSNFVGFLAGSPAVLRAYARFRSELRHGSLSWATQQRIALAVAEFQGSEYALSTLQRTAREAGLGLGVPRWRTTLSIVLPQTVGGIVTGTVLAVARVAGETAPLLFTSSYVGTQVNWNPHRALQSVPVAIFELSESADPQDHARAWAAALILLLFILFASLAARWLATRNRRRISAAR